MPAETDARRVLLHDGSATWLFPTLSDPVESDHVQQLLHGADEQLERLGRILGTNAGAMAWEPPAYRLTYYRLGPAPRFPTTELICEGWSDEVYVLVRLWTPSEPMSIARAGPPWVTNGWIELTCDVDDPFCPGHLIEERIGTPTNTPTAAAAEVRAVADWAFQVLTAVPLQVLQSRDAQRGHPVTRTAD